MFRSMLVSPLAVLIAGVGGVLVCRAIRINPHPQELLFACGLALLGSACGVLPIARLSHPTAATGFQAAFIGSILHLAICLAGACAIVLLRHPTDAFVYWMLVQYWLSLFSMCGVFVSRLRTSVRSMETVTH